MTRSDSEGHDATTRRRPETRGSPVEERIEAMVRDRLFAREIAPFRIGRFQVLEEIGRGGMGVVYSAYDDALDRKIAIKVVPEEDLPTEADRLRLLREAQALARLSHPNVVTVHEVGRADGELFVAMEFVRGQSLDAWFDDRPQWLDVLDAFAQAGRGLVAAHAAGLIHRDLKPHNIVRGDDGVVKVLDFGLARAVDAPSSVLGEDDDLDSSDITSSTLSSSLTRPGMVMGTPAYMSPEQMWGRSVDASSDQFSFCAALYEGLYGARPFTWTSVEEPWGTSQRLDSRPVPKGGKVPASVRDAIMRGLEPKPSDRWPSMEALLDALEWDPRRRRNRWLMVGAGAGLLVLGAVVALAVTPDDDAVPRELGPCSEQIDPLAGGWDDDRRADVRAAFLGIDKPYAASAWERTRDGLDAYADRWAAMHAEVCEAMESRSDPSPWALDAKMRCLNRAVLDLRATADTLADADSAVVERAHDVVAGLRPLSRCADEEALLAEVGPPPPEEAAAVEAARVELARARSQDDAGRAEQARRSIEAARAALDGVEYEPVRTEVSLLDGEVLDHLGEYDAAEAQYERALQLALRWSQRDEQVAALSLLMFEVGFQQRRVDEGLMLLPIVQELSRGRLLQEVAVRAVEAKLFHAKGDYERAAEIYRDNIERLQGHDAPQEVAQARASLGDILTWTGQYEESEIELRTALVDFEQRLGAQHPRTLSWRLSLSNVLRLQGRYDEAETECRSARSIAEESVGVDHPLPIMLTSTLAAILDEQGRYAEAESELRAAIPRLDEIYGPQHPNTASAHNSLAIVFENQGRFSEAEAEYRVAGERWSKTLGPRHEQVGIARNNLGNVLWAQGKTEDAEAEFRAALGIRLEAFGDDHPLVGGTRFNLASLLLELGRADEALTLAELAWEPLARDDVSPIKRGNAAMTLAKALWAVEGDERDRERGWTLAETALEIHREAGHDDEVEEIERWMEARRAEASGLSPLEEQRQGGVDQSSVP